MESLSPSDHADDRSDDIPEAYKNEATDKMRASQQFSSGNNFTQQLSIEEPEQVGDSTSDDTNSEHEQPNAVVDEEDEDKLIAESCKPLTSLMPSFQKETTRKFLFEAQAGLSGHETVHRYPCILEPASRRFFVWLGDLDYALFTKSTFLNLSNFAESCNALTITFLIYHQHRQKVQYRNMFKVIDAVSLGSEAVKELVGAPDR